MTLRTCRVACRDLKGVEHTVEVTADTLYEALAQGLRAFRDADWVSDLPHGHATITVVVKQPEVEHKIRVTDFENWLESASRNPAEMSLKSRCASCWGYPQWRKQRRASAKHGIPVSRVGDEGSPPLLALRWPCVLAFPRQRLALRALRACQGPLPNSGAPPRCTRASRSPRACRCFSAGRDERSRALLRQDRNCGRWSTWNRAGYADPCSLASRSADKAGRQRMVLVCRTRRYAQI